MSDTPKFSVEEAFQYFVHESGQVNDEITEKQFYYMRLLFHFGFRSALMLDFKLAEMELPEEEYEKILEDVFDETESVIAENEQYQLNPVQH